MSDILELQHQATSGNWTRRYQYGPDGNRLLATSAPGDGPGVYSHEYEYDAHGSMTAMPHLAEIAWDHADRMQSADLGGGGTVWFLYDSAGNRVRKIRVNLAGTSTYERIYVGGYEVYRERASGDLELERQTLHVADDTGRICLVETKTVEDGDPVTTPANISRYQYGNHLGSVGMELDETGALISYEEFHPYGTSAYRAANSAVDVSPSRYRYTAKERDEETGLDPMGLRYYASWLGRWTAADPIGLGDGINRYAYVRENPVGMRDPSGTLARTAEPEELPESHSEGISDEEFEREGREEGDASTPQGIPVGSAQDKSVSSLRVLREKLGLSLEVLEETLSTVEVKEAASNETTSFFGAWITVKLERDVLNAVFDIPRGLLEEERLADRRLLPVSEVGSLVHEATHAFLLSDSAAESVLSGAEEYYKGAPLVGGGVVKDAKLAAQEAAATYVAAQVTSLLEAHNQLTIAAQGLASGHEYGLEIAPEKIRSARQLLDRDLQNEKFGYVNVDGRQVNIDKRISPELAKFLDDRVLGGALSEARARLGRRVDQLEGQVSR